MRFNDLASSALAITGKDFGNAAVPVGEFHGLSHGYWKNHESAWVGYSPTQTLASVFGAGNVPASLATKTLREALKFGGGSGVLGAAKILYRNAVASLLNAAAPSINYNLTQAQIISQVNTAIASNDRATILALEAQLDIYNNQH